ncbi:MAG: prephenate dehydrogenase/arogenate dehydrogenase family protein [Dehalococcoidia bacterium]
MNKITLIGLTSITLSMGLKLKELGLNDLEITGSCNDNSRLNLAKKIGSIDKSTRNLKEAVENSKIIVIDSDMNETIELIEAISEIIDKDTIVTDTGIMKQPIVKYLNENMNREIQFIPSRPLIKDDITDIKDSNPKIFKDINYCVFPNKNTDPNSLKLLIDLIENLEANPLFMDINEYDSYAAAMSILPIIMSSAFVTATTNKESWREMFNIATSEFEICSRYASRDPKSNLDYSLANTEAITNWIDELIKELYTYRNLILEKNDILLDAFIKSWEERSKWETNSPNFEEHIEFPSATETMTSLFVGGKLAQKYREFMESDKKKRKGWEKLK